MYKAVVLIETWNLKTIIPGAQYISGVIADNALFNKMIITSYFKLQVSQDFQRAARPLNIRGKVHHDVTSPV